MQQPPPSNFEKSKYNIFGTPKIPCFSNYDCWQNKTALLEDNFTSPKGWVQNYAHGRDGKPENEDENSKAEIGVGKENHENHWSYENHLNQGNQEIQG